MSNLKEYIEEQEFRIKTVASAQQSDRYYSARKKFPLNERMIMYEAFFGRGMLCNPLALFKYILKDKRFSDFIHVWSMEDNEINAAIRKAYKGMNVIFVEPATDDYYRYLSEAKYLINNVTW